MAVKQIGQLGFADSLTQDVGRKGGAVLERVAGLIDWAAMEAALGPFYTSSLGEKGFPPLAMLKVLLLQCWHGLSDPEMEASLDDRMSFRRFAGFSADEAVPDHSTIWRFRQRLVERQLDQALLNEVERQLGQAGFLLKRGTIVDASLVASAARRPRMAEGKTSQTDKDARFGANNERRRFIFGYKLHVAADEGTGLVRAAILTPANIQEIDEATALVRGDERTVFADRGYDSRRLHDHLAAQGIANGVMRRGARADPAVQARNNAISMIRRGVEKIFGTLKRSYDMSRMRYFTMARNALRASLCIIAYNFRRMSAIRAAG